MTAVPPETIAGVLISVYAGDDALTFERALQSLLHQRLAPRTSLRIYLGVDGPVGTALEQVIARHAAALFRVLRSTKNRGLAVTLNELIGARNDESFFFRMDADDVSLPDRMQAQLDHLRGHPDIDILGTDIVEVDTAEGQRRIVAFLDRSENLRTFICFRPPVAHPTVCFRARVFDAVPAYPLVSGNEDIAMWFACASHGLVFDNLHRPLLEFTIGPNFWRRRSVGKAWSEFTSYWHGILKLWGPHWRLVFPVIRLLVRLSPTPVARLVYRVRARSEL